MTTETEKLRKTFCIDVEAMLAACVPGGSIADPQAIADAIRAWVAEQPAAQEAVAVVTLSQRHGALGSRMSLVRLTDAAKMLPAGAHNLYTRPAEPAAVPGKYDEVLKPFVSLMECELHANAGKGDRPGWLQMDRKTALLEIYYHLAKLQKATKDNDLNGVREYGADVANTSMMLVDVCGALPAAEQPEALAMWSFLRDSPAICATLPTSWLTPFYLHAPTTGAVFTYAWQPQNVPAWRLGEACTAAHARPGGDYIDRGLGLLKELQDRGFGVVSLAAKVEG